MEKLEARQLIQGIPFATTVLAKSPLSWSGDNNIAVVTQHGVYILELALSPEECTPAVMFTRFFLPPPDALSNSSNAGIDLKKLLHSIDQDTGHAIMLDSTLSASQRACVEQDPSAVRNTAPCMPGGEPVHRGYQYGAWSPHGVGEHGRCVLSLLTSNHNVSLIGRVGRHWGLLAEVSPQWHQLCSSTAWKRTRLPANAPLQEQYKARMELLAICQMVWTPIYEEDKGKYSMLIGLTESGCAVFWRVAVNLSSSEHLHIAGVEETNMTQIKTAHWYSLGNGSGYLVVGNSAGQVKVLHCEFNEEEVLLRDLGYVWDSPDRLSVSQLELCPVSSSQYLLVFAKHNILLVSSLHLTTESLTVNHTSHSYIGDLEISGLLVFKSRNAYVAIRDGFIKHIYINVSENGNTSVDQLDTVFRSEGVTYSDLVASPNKAMLCVFESIRVAYDHLIEREPTVINIYRVGDTSKIVHRLLESTSPLHLNADMFESLRIATCKAGQSSFSVMEAAQIPKEPLQQLKVHFWLAKIARSAGITDEDVLEELNEVELRLQETILRKWIAEVLEKFSTQMGPCTPSAVLSLTLMCDWMEEDDTENVKGLIEPLRKKLEKSRKEQCPVCGAQVSLTSLTHGTCGNGHTLPRCCRTLLLTEPVIQCSRCRVYAHADAKDIVDNDFYMCTYCHGHMASELNGRHRSR